MKNLYVLDMNNTIKYVIDYAESIIFNFKLNDIGDCEVYIPYINNDILDKIALNYIITDDTDSFYKSFVIKSIEIESSVSKGNYILIKGETLETLLKQRYIGFSEVYSGTIADNCETIINTIINEQDPLNKEISCYYHVSDSTVRDFEFEFTTVFDAIKSMCAIKNYCFELCNTPYDEYEFYIYEPEIASNVIFSPNEHNLLSFKKETNNYDMVNLAMVYFDTNDQEDPQGMVYVGEDKEKNELFVGVVDATDIKNNDSALFNRIMNNKGLSEIAQNKPKNDIDIEVDASMFRYLEYYQLGSIVKVVDFFGNEYNAKVIEVTEKWDNNGYACEPKLEIVNNT